MIISIIIGAFLALLLTGLFYPVPLADREQTRYRSRPWMTIAIISVNCLVFFIWQAPDIYGEGRELFAWARTFVYGFNPRLVREHLGLGAFTTFTSMFMHIHALHLFSNIIYLWAFGTRVEDAAGPWRFLIFYLFAGMLANVGFVFFGQSTLSVQIGRPSIGASGAVSGILGAYLILFYRERVTLWWGIGSVLRLPLALLHNIFSRQRWKLWRWTVSLPAWLFLVLFLVINVVPSLQTIQGERDLTGNNYLAHFAGYLAGLSVFMFLRKDLLMRYIQGRAL